MSEVRVIKVNENVFSDNDKEANLLREKLRKNKTFMINFMSSPGSGKTTLVTRLINELKDEFKIMAMDVDIETSIDASRIAKSGVKTIQIHNGGLCHIDADMTNRCIEKENIDGVDLLILENIGNLVCPAEFDTGAHKNIMLLSIPEGDDKPLKYPLMFTKSDIVVITKVDTLKIFNFDIEKCKENIKKLNPNAIILLVSSKTGEGFSELTSLIRNEVKVFKGEL